MVLLPRDLSALNTPSWAVANPRARSLSHTRDQPMNGRAKRSRVDADELADLRAQLFAHVTTLLEADPEADGSPAWSLCPCSAGVPPQGAPGGSGSSVLPGRGPVTERPATTTLLDADPEAMV